MLEVVTYHSGSVVYWVSRVALVRTVGCTQMLQSLGCKLETYWMFSLPLGFYEPIRVVC